MFLVYGNDLPDYLQNDSQIPLFTDDSKLYRTIESSSASRVLQLDCLHKWSLDWAVPSTARPYDLGDQPLGCVPYTTDLGSTVSTNLSWARHIVEMVAKAKKTLGHQKSMQGSH